RRLPDIHVVPGHEVRWTPGAFVRGLDHLPVEFSRAYAALDDLRGVEPSTEIAGPYCTALLAAARAGVAEVQAPGGRPLRRGRCGPWAGRAATEFVLRAWCGSTGSRGARDRPPVAAGGRLGEWIGGAYAAVAAVAAWKQARNTGRGEHVDVSLLECMSVTMNT